jgi:cytochrome b561
MAFRSAEFLTAELLGAALGMSLAVWGARRTRFLMTGGRLHYVPHTYAGIAVSLLFLGRLAFRLVQGYTGMPAPSAAPGAAHAAYPSQAFGPGMVKSPLTVGILCVLVGYYVCFYSWVLWKSKHLQAADVESDSAPLTQ